MPEQTCDKHEGAEMRQIPAGVSKKTGKPYNAFWVCEECDREKKANFRGGGSAGLKEINDKLDRILDYINSRS